MKNSQTNIAPIKARTTLAVRLDTHLLGGANPAVIEDVLRRHLTKLLSAGNLFTEALNAQQAQGEVVVDNISASVTTQTRTLEAQDGSFQSSAGVSGEQGSFLSDGPPFNTDDPSEPVIPGD